MANSTQVAPEAGAAPHPLNWMRTNRNESPEDRLHTKLVQAEALAVVLYADTGEAFRTLNDAVQDRVHWLMADLLTDARELLDAMNAQSRKARDA
jgi:hypothetical protein